MADAQETSKPDLKGGIPFDELADGGMVVGLAADEQVILARRGSEVFAIGAHCTHYHAPLANGLMVGDTLRCPWHHACFSLRTGEALRAPALDPIECWRVERVGEKVFVREKISAAVAKSPSPGGPASVLIVGGGAAGLAAADMLRREGYEGTVTLISADASPPCDRPNLSKDYLAGTAQEDWIPLRSAAYYEKNRIDLVLDSRVASIDVKTKRVKLASGKTHEFGALLLATGADPVRLPVPGAKAASAKRVVVIGASFIGLEVAASLRTRGIEVHVVAPDKTPLERVMGPDVGTYIRKVHESHGVIFHLGQTVSRVEGSWAILSDGSAVEMDFIVLGVGVRPAIALCEQAGLAMDRGVSVNEFLETSAPGIFAAGDIARWPDPHSGERIRVEHWVVAERQGQVAAKNILGQRVRYDAVPFFWSQHYDVAINYVGHAEKWDAIEIDGSIDANDCAVTYKQGGRTLAVATIYRDLQSLQAELSMEQNTLT